MRSNHQDKITDRTNCAHIWGRFTVFAAGIQIIFQNAYEIWLSLSYAVTHNTPFHIISVQQKLTFLASLRSLFWQSLPMFGSSAPHMLTTCPICFSWLDLWMKSYIYLCSPSLHIHLDYQIFCELFFSTAANMLKLWCSLYEWNRSHRTTKDGKSVKINLPVAKLTRVFQ